MRALEKCCTIEMVISETERAMILKFRQKYMAGLLCLAMAASVSGCGSSNTVEKPEQEPETVSVWDKEGNEYKIPIDILNKYLV